VACCEHNDTTFDPYTDLSATMHVLLTDRQTDDSIMPRVDHTAAKSLKSSSIGRVF